MNVVFMGTPDFALPSLQALLTAGHLVSGVFTQPDKPKGRGKKLSLPPVKEYAVSKEIPVFQPKTLRSEEEMERIKALAPDVIVVAAYGKILPPPILDIPKYGCVNVHASLLPKYRGAGPIQWCVLNGETETGVTTMQMAQGVDTGDILLQEKTPIFENETAGELQDRLASLGGPLLLKTLDMLEKGTLKPTPQDDTKSCDAPMLTKELSKLDFSLPAHEVHDRIRGLSPWPCAETFFLGKRLKVYHSKIVSDLSAGQPGEILDDKAFVVACGQGTAICLTEVQQEGAKRLNGADFLRGHAPPPHTVLGINKEDRE